MDEKFIQQIELLQKENAKLTRQLARLEAKLEHHQALAASLGNIKSMQEVEWKKQRQYLRLLLENSPDIFILFDRDMRFTYCSNTFLHVAGIEHFSLINGKLFSEVFSNFVDASWVRAMAGKFTAAVQEHTAFTFEESFNISGKALRKYMAYFTPMLKDDGTPGGALLLFHDITEIRAAQENADAARQDAENASQAKSEFLANMSHEIRTPLNAVIGMTALAKPATNLEQKNYYLQKIEGASQHLLSIINDILDMSKIEANKLELSFAPFNFEKMLQKVVNVVIFLVEKKNLNFQVKIDQNIPDTLSGDDQRLAQVIANLLSNAIKFTPEHGFVGLETYLEQEANGICTIRISVTDSGIGLSEEQQARLFASFHQADSSTSRKFGGTGLGLAISKRLVEMMGGNIRISSELGKGATFTFTTRLQSCADAQSAPLVATADPGAVRICAVSDSMALLSYFQDIFQKYGFACDLLAGGEKLLERISQNAPYDVCFIDWSNHDSDKVESVRRIREQGNAGRIVITATALIWDAIANDMGAIGVNDFLHRPLFPSNVLACLNKCLDKTSCEEDAASAENTTFLGYRILLAEDVEINKEIVLASLEQTQLEIDCAENGREAVEMFSAAPDRYDMIFMDIQMPEMDGYAAARCIRSLDVPGARMIPIVAMTANVFREDVQRCLDAGMNDHVGKPLDFNIVLEKLRRYLPAGRHPQSAGEAPV